MVGTAASTWGFSLATVNPTSATLAVMIVSAAKVALIMAFFMELKIAPRSWQAAGAIWLGITTMVVAGIYLLLGAQA